MTVARTLPAMLERNARVLGSKPFLVDERDAPLDWGQAWDVARRRAAGLAALGTVRGEPVVVALDNRREFVETWFGLATLGAIEVPMNPNLLGDRLVHVIAHSQARLAVVEPRVAERIESLKARLPALERVVVVGSVEGRATAEQLPFSVLDPESPLPSCDVGAGDTVAVMYTSGSTGRPKGAMLPHGQHFTNGSQAVAAAGIAADDVIYLCLPLHHNMAQGYGVWPAIVAGATVRLAPSFERETFWAGVAGCGATVFPFVGGVLMLLVKQDEQPHESGNPLRVAYGVPVPADIHEEAERRFGMEVVHAYGSTEATIPAWNVGSNRAIGSAGKVIEGYEVAILDDDDAPVPPGDPGEICIRPREAFTMFQGYYRDAERTVAAFRNLWFHSGDRGRLDADGNLWFLGRMGDVIRRLGEFVTADEVEAAIVRHPGVLAVAAFGVPSELSEEEVMAAVVLRDGASTSADEIRQWAAERLPPFAVPRFVEFVAELPMTPTGKIEKYRLKRRGVTDTTDDARARKEAR